VDRGLGHRWPGRGMRAPSNARCVRAGGRRRSGGSACSSGFTEQASQSRLSVRVRCRSSLRAGLGWPHSPALLDLSHITCRRCVARQSSDHNDLGILTWACLTRPMMWPKCGQTTTTTIRARSDQGACLRRHERARRDSNPSPPQIRRKMGPVRPVRWNPYWQVNVLPRV
jgi:hypothetical protein